MSQTLNAAIAVAGIDIGKNSFHIVDRGPVISSAMVVAIGEGMCSTRAATSSPPGARADADLGRGPYHPR